MEEEEVTVSSSTPTPRKARYPGLSPLKAGLLYGGAASTVMGPLGLLIGLGSGLVAGRMRKSWLDRQAAETENLRAEYQGTQQELDAEMRIADPDEKRLLEHAKRIANEGWKRLESGDPTGRQMIVQANELSRGIINADIQARKQEQASTAQFQRGLIQSSATAYREEYQKNLAQYEEINGLADRVLRLAADAGFDPNKPFNKAVMTDLLTVGVGGLYRDAPGLLGEIPIVGAFLERGKDALEGKFDLTREDYNRIALNMKQANELVSEDRMVRLGEQSRQLDDFARKSGAIPQDYSLGEYVSGGTQELRFTEPPRATPTPTRTLPGTKGDRGLFSESETGRRIEEWVQKKVGPKQKQPRPTN